VRWFSRAPLWSYVLGIPTGDVVIFPQRRLSTLTQYFTWFGKSLTSTGESHCIRDRERITTQYMEEEDHIHSNSTPSSHTLLHIAAGLLPMAAAPLSLFFSSLHSHTLSHLLSNNYASFIGKYGQHWWDKEALKHATICGINGATTCLVVGYCHQMAIS
jgi:hypothetical protein